MSLMAGVKYSIKSRKEYALQMITEQPFYSIEAFRLIKMREILADSKAKAINF